jgi:hypothetical protein
MAWLRDPDHLLAIVAIGFALIQFIDARVAHKRMEQLVESMSTRFVGLFPKNFTEVVNVVHSANRELLIMTDFVTYGSYSAPHTFGSFLHELTERSKEGVTVRILRYSDRLCRQFVVEQFPEAGYGEIRKDIRFVQYSKAHNLDTATHAQFIDRLIADQSATEAFLLDTHAIEIRTLDKEPPLFLWLEDQEDAVFAFKYPGSPTRGFSFRTRDGSLINNFTQLFESHWKQASRIQRHDHGPAASG